MIAHRFAPVLRELQPLSERFAAAGHRLFLVGGTVRDLVLAESGDLRVGQSISSGPAFDIDATTTARPDEIKRCLQGWADAVWTQGERFGTIGAVKRVPSDVPGAAPGATIERVYEITTHRAEAYRDDSRKPDVEFSDDIHADLSRRDFTVNAMAVDVTAATAGGELVLVDPFGGIRDLADRVLRTPLAPETSFSDDPLRMLRAARFIARYGLQPEPELLRAVRSMSDRMQIVSAERIRDELDKLLAAPAPREGLRFVAETGLMQYVVPELVAATSQPDAGCHPDRWAHAVALVDAVPPQYDERGRLARWTALLHPMGVEHVRERLRALRHANDDTRDIARLVEWFTALTARLDADDAPWSDPDLRRFACEVAGLRPVVRQLVGAEVIVRTGLPAAAPSVERGRRLQAGIAALDDGFARLGAREPLDDFSPELDGAEVMRVLGVGPGRVVGDALDHLAQLRLDEGLLGEDEARRRLEEWWSHHAMR